MAKVSKVTGTQLRSPRAMVAQSPPGRTAEPPLDILPISVQSLSAQSAELPSGAPKRDENSLLVSVELTSGLYHPSYETLTSRGRMPCLSRRPWPYRFRERPLYVPTPLFVHPIIDFDWPLPLSRFCRWLPT